MAELNQEMIEDMMLRRDEIIDEIENEVLDVRQHRELQSELSRIQKALGEDTYYEDDLIEKWERQIANGETPDLTEGLA